VRAVRLSPSTIRCGDRCRPATLRFRLAAPGTVAAMVARRRCRPSGCRYRRVGGRSAALAAGRHTWRVGPRVAGVRLTAGRWRLTLRTSAGRVRVAFRVTA
jgi:hypothetical protein